MKITVCELQNHEEPTQDEWRALCRHVHGVESDLLLLPEMPFSRWLAAHHELDPEAWADAVSLHDRWLDRLVETGARTVACTRPVLDDGRHYNQAVVWDRAQGLLPVQHRKRHLPQEEGFWEETWTDRGPDDVEVVDTAIGRLGFAVCTELWFMGRVRALGQAGVQLLLCPRATPAGSVERWLIGGQAASIVSGAYCLSSNFSGPAEDGDWGGAAFVTAPEDGAILARSNAEHPFVTVQIDLDTADRAKKTYPRYVKD